MEGAAYKIFNVEEPLKALLALPVSLEVPLTKLMIEPPEAMLCASRR